MFSNFVKIVFKFTYEFVSIAGNEMLSFSNPSIGTVDRPEVHISQILEVDDF